MLSAGTLIGDSWGIDVMYYDLGSSSIKVDALDYVKIDNVEYEVQTGGTISNDISGYGIGLIGVSDADMISFYVKAGIHAWDKSCLLYTSPSPRDRQKSRMPSSA